MTDDSLLVFKWQTLLALPYVKAGMVARVCKNSRRRAAQSEPDSGALLILPASSKSPEHFPRWVHGPDSKSVEAADAARRASQARGRLKATVRLQR